MRDSHPRRLLDDVLELLHRADVVLADRLTAMSTAQHGWPPSANLDPTTRGGGSHWCWTHERDVVACHRAELDCRGEVVTSPGDSVGEAAARRDRAYDDREMLLRSLRSLHVEAERVMSLLARYGSRPATAGERRETLRSGERSTAAFECWSCARVVDNHGNAWFQPAARRVSIADGESRLLCEWCRSWVRDVGSLPSVRQVDEHRRGVRVRRPRQAS